MSESSQPTVVVRVDRIFKEDLLEDTDLIFRIKIS